MEKGDSLNNGHVIEVTTDMFEQASNDFSEGNENLKKLLMFCFENGIKTRACCSGHNGEKSPYVMFEFCDENMNAILKILSRFSFDDGIIDQWSFRNEPGTVCSFQITMKKDKYNEGFEQTLEVLKSEKEVELTQLDQNRQLIVKSLQNYNIPNSFLYIKEEKDSISIAVDDKYVSVFYSGEELIPWGNSWLAEYPKDSMEANITLRRLESRTKNSRYIKSHPYNQEKIQEFWNNKDSSNTIKINGEATRERKREYKEENVVQVEILLGSDINMVANQIMQLHRYGQACITRFNSFEIDSRDYASPEEIVHAYMQEYEKHRKNRAGKRITIGELEEAITGGHVKISDVITEMDIYAGNFQTIANADLSQLVE